MAIDFHSRENRSSYSTRAADPTWVKKINDLCDVKGKKVLDIGCGGGIYTKALAMMGASSVTGVDFSRQQLLSAKENCREYSNIDFRLGDALDTKLENDRFDIVLERAVIHHIKDLTLCANEIYRVLKPGGICIIQDRTPEDCLVEGSKSHIRGYFLEKFPPLIRKETSRRHSSEKVRDALQEAGFKVCKEYKLWEVRKTYNDIEELVRDLMNRTGRSILHELTDRQLEELAVYIKRQNFKPGEPIVEKDRWTIWHAVK